MKKTVATFATLAILGLAVPQASAGRLISSFRLPNPATLISNATQAVSKGLSGLLNRANEIGKGAIQAAQSTLTGMVGKVVDMAKNAAAGAKQSLFAVADRLVQQLPSFLKPFAGKAVTAGKSFIGGLQGKLGGFIEQAANHARGLVSKATNGALSSLGGLADLLKRRGNEALGVAAQIANGALKRMQGQISALWNKGNGAAQRVLSTFHSAVKKFIDRR